MQKKSAVIAFVEDERAKGVGDLDIQHKLLDAGWQIDIIHWALGKTAGDQAKPFVANSKSDAARKKELLLSGAFILSIVGITKLLPRSRAKKSR